MEKFIYSKKFTDIPVIGGSFAKRKTDLVPLSFGYPHPFTFPKDHLVKASIKALTDGGDGVLQYTGGEGKDSIRDWISNRVKSKKIHTTKNNILITSGANQAIDLITRSLTDPGDTVWLESPSFFGAIRYFMLAELKTKTFEVDTKGIKVEDVEQALINAKNQNHPIPKFIYIIANHHNPTGVSLTIERRKKLAQLAKQYNFYIIEDDAYGELNFTEDNLPSIYSFCPERVIYISSFSKIFGPGLRLGWTIAHTEVLHNMQIIKSEGNSSVFVQEIVHKMLEDFDFVAHVNKINNFYKKRCNRMVDALKTYFGNEISFSIPKGGFFIWVTFPEHVDTNLLLEKSIEIYNVDFFLGENFFISNKKRNHARLSFTYCDDKDIDSSIERISKAYFDLYG